VSEDDLECVLAESLYKTANYPVKEFASSDCRCKSHLFTSSKIPCKILFLSI